MAQTDPTSPSPKPKKDPAPATNDWPVGAGETGAGASGGSAAAGAEDNASPRDEAKAKFGKAIDEARAGVQALTREAQETAGAYRDMVTGTSSEWVGQAQQVGGQAWDRAFAFAQDNKTRASGAIAGIGQVIAENAAALDEKLGPKYGEYARTAAQTIQDAAARLEAKDLNELGGDAREFIRKSPGMAIGMAAVAGYVLSRMFKGSDD